MPDRHIEPHEFFREVTLRICGTLEIGAALVETFEFASQYIPMDSIGLGYFDPESGLIRTLAEHRLSTADYVWKDGAAEIAVSPDLFDAMRPAEVQTITVVNRPTDFSDPRWLEAFPRLSKDSAIFLALHVSATDIGVLLISAKGQSRYSAQHAELLKTVRDPFAIAMGNSRRYHELLRMQSRLAADHRALSEEMRQLVGSEVIGADHGLREVMQHVGQIAGSESPALVLGETGTGKEVIANAIHVASPRKDGPMIAMQCGAIPDALLDSELFGHEKGAFTGASERKRGRFERADGGTLFLDEIGELSLGAQVKLLRVLQERRFERIGGTETIDIDVRVIAATHRDLKQMVCEGTFREDLWYRLNVLPIHIPPLRLRQEDIPALTQHFVLRKAREMKMSRTPIVTEQGLKRLQQYPWPGNIRELQNVVERALILAQGDQLYFADLSNSGKVPEYPGNRARSLRTMDEVTAEHIRHVLEHVDGQVAGKGGAAEILQMNPSTLRFRMKKLGIVSK